MESKPWELSITQYAKCRNSFTELTIQKNTAHAAQKKMLEYLFKESCNEHPYKYRAIGENDEPKESHYSPDRIGCPVCVDNILAEFGIGEEK